jgi:2-polyprenyl-6-methoxyphenol hydroxylase-like FAD-dependent oxidoreductase
MIEEIQTDSCVAGGGIAGVLLAHRLAASGKRIVPLAQGSRFSEEDRIDLLNGSKAMLNDIADYNDDLSAAVTTPHSSASSKGQVTEWIAQRLFGVGGRRVSIIGPRLDAMPCSPLRMPRGPLSVPSTTTNHNSQH